MVISNLAEVAHEELFSTDTGEKFSVSFAIASSFGFKNVCCFHDIVPPGRRSSLPHIHSQKEELVVVLSGNPTLTLGEESRELKPGDFVGFAPGQRPLHVIENRTQESAAVLVIASNPPNDEPFYV